MYISFKWIGLGILICGLTTVSSTSAAVIVDQSNLPGPNFYNPLGPTSVPNETTAEMAQTFTPGINGQITGISVDLLSVDNGPGGAFISLELVSVSGGIPDTTTPLSTTVTQLVPAGTGFAFFDLSSQNINLSAGVTVAYWLTGDPAFGFSRWIGSNGSSYSGGEAYVRFPGATDGSPTVWTDWQSDAYFQTFMNTPEPSTAAILGLGLVAMGLRRRLAKRPSK